ncbi:hypothetical protein EVAR_34629_1 [Eumeta japonica]|uniref:Uncharacterized protein n=1 Tax=Eumeta variegata TaxID=151549 RepID=A0A4C1VG49_EUMVA|nr:hypothetical protein EVAR_34629_1 [Eumeta japonica]
MTSQVAQTLMDHGELAQYLFRLAKDSEQSAAIRKLQYGKSKVIKTSPGVLIVPMTAPGRAGGQFPRAAPPYESSSRVDGHRQGHSQPQKGQQSVANFFVVNRISNRGIGLLEGEKPLELPFTGRNATTEAATSCLYSYKYEKNTDMSVFPSNIQEMQCQLKQIGEEISEEYKHFISAWTGKTKKNGKSPFGAWKNKIFDINTLKVFDVVVNSNIPTEKRTWEKKVFVACFGEYVKSLVSNFVIALVTMVASSPNPHDTRDEGSSITFHFSLANFNVATKEGSTRDKRCDYCARRSPNGYLELLKKMSLVLVQKETRLVPFSSSTESAYC